MVDNHWLPFLMEYFGIFSKFIRYIVLRGHASIKWPLNTVTSMRLIDNWTLKRLTVCSGCFVTHWLTAQLVPIESMNNPTSCRCSSLTLCEKTSLAFGLKRHLIFFGPLISHCAYPPHCTICQCSPLRAFEVENYIPAAYNLALRALVLSYQLFRVLRRRSELGLMKPKAPSSCVCCCILYYFQRWYETTESSFSGTLSIFGGYCTLLEHLYFQLLNISTSTPTYFRGKHWTFIFCIRAKVVHC